MAIIVYKCNVCNREIEKLQNKEGLEVVQRCIITSGCRGKLYQVDVKEDHIRGKTPATVKGLSNWVQRNALYNHTQSIKKATWKIVHNMGIIPAVSAWVSRPTQDDPDYISEVIPEDIIIISKNEIHLVFDRTETGIAQLVATDTAKQKVESTTQSSIVAQSTQITTNGEISIAVPINLPNASPNTIGLQLTFINELGQEVIHNFISIDSQASINSPWSDYNRVVIRSKVYSVRSFNLIDDPIAGGIIDSISNRVITSGSSFTFTGIDVSGGTSYRTINRSELYILMSNSPYESIDKNRGILVDVYTNTNQFAYVSGEATVLTSDIQTVYPLITSV